MYKRQIRKIREDEVEKIREKMAVHIKEIEDAKQVISGQEDVLQTVLDDVKDKPEMKTKSENAKSLRRDIESQVRSHQQELSFYQDHDDCPTCKQGIEHEFKAGIISEKDTKLA